VNLQQGIIKDFFVKLLAKLLVRILTSLLYANYKENLMTKFSTNRQNRFKGLSLFIHISMGTAHFPASPLKNQSLSC